MTHLGIIGFGSQAQAFSSNLSDSGIHVSILLRKKSPSLEKVKEKSFPVVTYTDEEVPKDIDHLIILTPDHTHGTIIKEITNKNTKRHFCFILAHGFSFLKENLNSSFPNSHFALLAPKAIASELRERYLTKQDLIAVLDSSQYKEGEKDLIFIAEKLGITQIIKNSFKDEAQADLFSEQTLLCSLLPYGAMKSYDFLVSKGIDPDLAFVECWMEVKLIADAMLKEGPLGYLNLISPNAFIGGEKASQQIFDNAYQKKLHSLWDDIENGSFFHEVDKTDLEKMKKKVLEKWEHHPLQKSYLNYKARLKNES